MSAMSNFSFLQPYGRDLAENGKLAETYLYSDPDGCANKLRSIAETIAEQVTVSLPSKFRPKPFNGQQPSLAENLRSLEQAERLPDGIRGDFHAVRKVGNGGAHSRKVPIRDAQDALEATYRVARWYVRDYRRSKDPIPEFSLPQKAEDAPQAEAEEKPPADLPAPKFGSKREGWIAGALSVIGLIWLLEIVRDPRHRGDHALRNTLRLLFVVAAIAALLVPMAIIAHGASLWTVYRYFIASISEKLAWNAYLIDALVLALLPLFLYGTRLLFSPRSRARRRAGAAVLLAMAIGWDLSFYFTTRHIAFWFGNGAGIKYYARTDHGVEVYDRPGFDPETGQRLLPVTPEIARELQIQMNGGSMKSIDPAKANWFNPYTGKPVLWYYRFPNGELTFYDKPGMDPQTGDLLTPVTKELYLKWRSERASRPGREVGAGAHPGRLGDSFASALNAGAGNGQSGVLFLPESGLGRQGADALTRNLPGLNTTALRAAEIQRAGFADRLYDGDKSLVNEALSVTRLRSLMVAEVAVQCARRTTLDPDLLSCDLTAKARKFGADGNLAGAMRVEGTGAGFNQGDAVEQAAQRASVSLLSLARR
jgi:Domain of unknown function (DUF4145)